MLGTDLAAPLRRTFSVRWRAILGAIGIFVAMMSAVVTFHQHQERFYLHRQHLEALKRLHLAKTQIEGAILRRLHLLHGLSAFVNARYQVDHQDFVDFTTQLDKSLEGIDTLILAPQGRIAFVTNYWDYQELLGQPLSHLLTHRETLDKAQPTDEAIIDPWPQAPDGKVIIGVLPIFRTLFAKDTASPDVWGFAAIRIDMKPIFAEAQRMLQRIEATAASPLFSIRAVPLSDTAGDLTRAATGVVRVKLAHLPWELVSPTPQTPKWPYRIWLWAGGLTLTALVAKLTYDLILEPSRLRQTIFVTTRHLQETEDRYRDVLELVPVGILIFQDATVQFANPTIATYLGLQTSNQVLGLTPADMYPLEYHRVVQQRLASIDSPHVTFPVLETSLRCRDGSLLPVEEAAQLIQYKDRPALMTIFRDISQQKAAEQLMRQAKDSAEAANRAKTEFLTHLSHEIRTPLNGVLGMASLLLHSDLSHDQRQRISTIKASGDMLLKILNDILDLSRIEANRLDLEAINVDLRELVRSLSDLWEPQIQAKGLVFHVHMALSVPILRGDPTRLRQILFNFIDNAVKFTDTGHIAVRVSQAPLQPGWINTRFEVVDSGVGIDPIQQVSVFNPFTQAEASTARKHGGSGLGLSICKRLAEAMGGQVGVESAPGKGSHFWFTVPCEAGAATPGSATHLDAIPPHERTLQPGAARILIAEDNPINQTVLREILEPRGYQVDLVHNGLEAVDAIRRSSYDLVLMDIRMPQMDGVRATQCIRQLACSTPEMPIIAVTANAMKRDRERYLAVGMNDVITKPVDRDQLLAAINRQLLTLAPVAQRGN